MRRAAGTNAAGRVAAVAALIVLATGAVAAAQDTDQPRLYMGVRIGESNPITKANDVAGVSLGANLDRHLGFEFSFDAYELFLPSSRYDRAAELGIAGLLPQLRLRYPLLDDRLVPYVLVGGGLAIAQINDAKEPTQWAGSGSLTSLRAMGAFGGGVEYFLSNDITFGVEGKYYLTGRETYDTGGEKQTVDMNAGVLTFGLRLFYPETDASESRLAEARSAIRPYVNVRFGGALRMAGDVFDGVRTEPEQSMLGSNFAPYFAVGVGMTFGRHFDLEISGQNYELRLEPSGGGSSEYAVFPVLVQPKLHFPLDDLRLDPYVLVGVGFDSTELSDSSGEDGKVTGNSLGVIGAFGGGLDWFATSDIAVGLEAKYVVSRGHTLRIGDGPELDGNLDALFLSLGVRAYLADF